MKITADRTGRALAWLLFKEVFSSEYYAQGHRYALQSLHKANMAALMRTCNIIARLIAHTSQSK